MYICILLTHAQEDSDEESGEDFSKAIDELEDDEDEAEATEEEGAKKRKV